MSVAMNTAPSMSPPEKQHELGRGVARRIGEVQRTAEQSDRGEDGDRDAPVHHVARDQVGAAAQDQQRRGLAGGAAGVAGQQVGGRGELLVELPGRERRGGADTES